MAGTIIDAYPDARFLHMVRDPRDRYVALTGEAIARGGSRWSARRCTGCARPRSRAVTPCAIPTRIGRSATNRSSAAARRPSVRSAAFLDEDFEPAMLRMESERRYDAERLASPTGSPLTDEYVGCHRDVLDRWARSFVGVVARPQMRALGYADVAVAIPEEARR